LIVKERDKNKFMICQSRKLLGLTNKRFILSVLAISKAFKMTSKNVNLFLSCYKGRLFRIFGVEFIHFLSRNGSFIRFFVIKKTDKR